MTITPQTIESTLRSAGVTQPIISRERTPNYEYLTTGDVGVTWYVRTRPWGPEAVYELEVPGRSVADAAENPGVLLESLARELATQ